MVTATLVSLRQPCTACLITCDLLKGMLEKIKQEYACLKLEYIELESLKDAPSVNGLEVENFPALLINGEQITAGSLPMKGHIVSIIEMEAGMNEEN